MSLQRFRFKAPPVDATGEDHDSNETRFRNEVTRAFARGDTSFEQLDTIMRVIVDVLGDAILSALPPGAEYDAAEAAIEELKSSGALSHKSAMS